MQHLRRADLVEKFLRALELRGPLVLVHADELLERVWREAEALRVECAGRVVGHEPDGRLLCGAASGDPLEDPREDARVVTVPGPQKFPVGALAEYVELEDLREWL